MEETVVFMGGRNKDAEEIRSVLEEENYRVLSISAVKDLTGLIQKNAARALILDIGLVPVDNRALRELRRDNPDLCIIALSDRSFHPELKEAMSHYIDACFAKPVEWEGLLFYLRSALRNGAKKAVPSSDTRRDA